MYRHSVQLCILAEKVIEFGSLARGTSMLTDFEILDISQTVDERTACFPGDVPFSKVLTVTYAESKVINLSAITMSPHVGTHADAPSHICGNMDDAKEMAGAMPLAPYVGPALVLNLAPMENGPVTADAICSELQAAGITKIHPRVLLRTQGLSNENFFKADYAYIGIDAVEYLSGQKVELVGIDTPSVDQINCKSLETHHVLRHSGFYWLENLNLNNVVTGEYFLVAAPIKLTSTEAAPVRALLLRPR